MVGQGENEPLLPTCNRCDDLQLANPRLFRLFKVTAERASKAEASRVEKSSKEPKKSSEVNGVPEPPSTNSEYRVRLVSQNKELYKDPPQSPVLDIRVFPEKASGPSRAANGDFTFSGFSTFKPNRSPEEVLRGGAFGGTYFRPIVSAVTNLRYTGKEAVESSCHSSWVEGLDAKVRRSGVGEERSEASVKIGLDTAVTDNTHGTARLSS